MIGSLWEIYIAQLKTSLVVQFQYRAALVIWMIGRIMQPLVFLVVWTTIARTRGGEVNGYDVGGFAAYFILQMIVSQLTFSWIMWEYDYVIRSGQFNFKLLRPIHPIHTNVADNVAYKILTLVILISAALLLAWLFRPTFNFQLWSVVAGIVSIGMAFVVCLVIEWTLAMSALWTNRVNVINQTYEVLLVFRSGFFAPLAVMPRPLQVLADLLPFRWLIGFPIELTLGRLAPQQALFGFAMQGFWLVVAITTLSFVWRAG